MLVRKLTMLPVEAIIRGYITGSGWVDYQKSGSVCGHALPAGLQNCAQLPAPLFTPSTKAELGDHDENITVERCDQILGEAPSAAVATIAKQVYEFASTFAKARGILVADTKMEFGTVAGSDAASLVLGDEVLTPDCSRYWPQEGYEVGREQNSFDKQYVRNYLKSINFDKATPLELPPEVIAQTLDKYLKIFKLLTGAEPRL